MRVGHWTDEEAGTGCTAVVCEAGASVAVDVRGGLPGTRDCSMLEPGRAPVPVHAIVLAGGSNLGLEAAAGAARWLRERGMGMRIGRAVVPRVPSAVIFDRGAARGAWPGVEAGIAACESAGAAPAQGKVGAGAGATVGKLLGIDRASPGGVGSRAVRVGGATVGALMVVNAVGGVHGPDGRPVAGPRDPRTGQPVDSVELLLRADYTLPSGLAGASTVIGFVATDAAVAHHELVRIARIAQAGLASVVRPAHTDLDGDAIFCLTTGSAPPVDVTRLGAAAAHATARAIVAAVTAAGAGPSSASGEVHDVGRR